METTHATFQESLGAYAVGALDSPEIAALELHLETCDSCRSELAAYRKISEGLLRAVPPRTQPDSIRKTLQAIVRGRSDGRSRFRRWSWTPALAASALVVMVGLTLNSMGQVRSLQNEQARLAAQNRSTQTFIAMLAYPGTRTLPFAQAGITGTLLVDEERGLVGLSVWQLPPAEAGKTYQIWLIDSRDQRTSGGFLDPNDGDALMTAVIRPASPLASYKGLGVTAEPSGGSPAPTGPKLFGVDFQQ